MTRGQLLRRAAGVALGASLLGKLPEPVAAAPLPLPASGGRLIGLRSSIPAGWLPCDGRRVPASLYPDLAVALRPDGADLFGTGPYRHPTRTFEVEERDDVTLPFLVGYIIKAEHSGPHDHSALAGMAVGGLGPTRMTEGMQEQVPPGAMHAHWHPGAV